MTAVIYVFCRDARLSHLHQITIIFIQLVHTKIPTEMYILICNAMDSLYSTACMLKVNFISEQQ